MSQLVQTLATLYPELHFVAGKQFCWSPESDEVVYKADVHEVSGDWSLLHETGHALLGHQSYQGDYELLSMEVAAWQKAREIASALGISIDNDHIEDCLDTYRDWLYRRSICPSCQTKCLQQDDNRHYRCFNCHTTWRVSSSRFCRSYRKKQQAHLTPIPVFSLSNTLE